MLHIIKMDVYYLEQDTDEGNENMKKRAMEIYQLKDAVIITLFNDNSDESEVIVNFNASQVRRIK